MNTQTSTENFEGLSLNLTNNAAETKYRGFFLYAIALFLTFENWNQLGCCKAKIPCLRVFVDTPISIIANVYLRENEKARESSQKHRGKKSRETVTLKLQVLEEWSEIFSYTASSINKLLISDLVLFGKL